MTSERESFREPPLVLCDGRLLIYADGEWVAFLRDGKSWTSGVLDSRDVSALLQHLPIMADNTMQGSCTPCSTRISPHSCRMAMPSTEGGARMVRFGSASRRGSVVTDLYATDLAPVFTSRFDDFELYEDGEWRVWQDGRVIASGAFNRRDLTELAETAIRVEQLKVGIYDDDRIEPH